MKHEISTYRTKQSLAASLRCLLEQKPLSKITVSEIVAGCGVNRKTFYYHFQDIYSLLHWMLEQDTMEVIRDYQKHDNYHEILLFALQYLDGNQHLLNCVCDLAGYMEVRRFLMQSLTELTYPLILKAEAESDITLNEAFRKRLCHFYSTALSGFFLEILQGSDIPDSESFIQDVRTIFQESLPCIIQSKGKPFRHKKR